MMPTFPIPRWALLAIGVGLLALALVFAIISYGNSRFDAGEAAADAKWKAASEKLVEKAQKSSAKQDTAAAARAADYAAKVEDEKQALERAEAEGSSPLDVLFGVK